MQTPDAAAAPNADNSAPETLEQSFANALRFWEPRRIVYNAVLTVVVIIWILVTWPHFRPAFTWLSLLFLVVAAFLANLCYCAAYFVDIPLQRTALSGVWRRRRWVLWALGMLLALLFENYWIVDEIYPYVG